MEKESYKLSIIESRVIKPNKSSRFSFVAEKNASDEILKIATELGLRKFTLFILNTHPVTLSTRKGLRSF